ncbi:MAG: MBL fold metallo-hydrolase [Eubacteriales bacterium]|nr:MBL fold metallo-hydrolase [Eubacteriales bacterium]
MALINVFGHKIKPLKLRGTGVFNPTPTGKISEELFCIKQWDVNIWIYKKNNCVIAFDSGYENFPEMDSELSKIALNSDSIQAVFLTHADMDHAGGVSDRNNYFKRADLYLSEKEERMIRGEENRFVFGPIKLKNSISRKSNYRLLHDGEKVDVGAIRVEMIATPGHTHGHSAYLVDDQVLITGDCIAINQTDGFGFFAFYNMDTEENLHSIQRLRDKLKDKKIRFVCTGHSGYCDNFDRAFSRIHEVAKGNKRHPFDCSAPYDIFK